MSKPDWCPQDVWEAACAEADKTSGASEHTVRKIAAHAILAERERCRAIANERAAQLWAAIQMPNTDEERSGWAGQMIEAIAIEQRIASGHQPKVSINIEGLHSAAKENGFPL